MKLLHTLSKALEPLKLWRLLEGGDIVSERGQHLLDHPSSPFWKEYERTPTVGGVKIVKTPTPEANHSDKN